MRDALLEQVLKTLESIEGLLSDWMRASSVAKGAFRTVYKDFRESRKRRRGGWHSIKQWRALKEFYNFTCLACGRREPEIKLTKDHVNPKGLNDVTNIQPLCEDCNVAKGDAHIDYRGTDHAIKAIRGAHHE